MDFTLHLLFFQPRRSHTCWKKVASAGGILYHVRMNTQSKRLLFLSLALAASLLSGPSVCATEPAHKPKKEVSARPPTFVHDPEVVLARDGPRLRVPLSMEYEERFYTNIDGKTKVEPPYDFSVVTSVRFRDDHWIYELDWAPFGVKDPGIFVNEKDELLGPDQSWVALPIFGCCGIYFESLDTLQHSLQTNEAAGFLLTCEGKDKPFEENVICGYQIQKWTGPHTLLLHLSVGESNATLKVDLVKRTVEGKLPIENCKMVFGPMKDLCTKKKPSMKSAAAPSAGH